MCLLFSFRTCATAAEFLGMEISRDMGLKGIRMPLESRGARIGDVTIEEVVMGPRRLDVLLISVLPQPVIRGMRIVVDQDQTTPDWRQALGLLFRENQILRQGRIEGMRLVVLPASRNLLIEAREGRYARPGGLILRDARITCNGKRRFCPQLEIPFQGSRGDWEP